MTWILHTDQPLEVGTRIRLGGREGKVFSYEPSNLKVVSWADDLDNEGREDSWMNLDKYPELEIWVDDELERADYLPSPQVRDMFFKLAQAVERSRITIEPGKVIHLDDMLSASKLIAELKKLSEV